MNSLRQWLGAFALASMLLPGASFAADAPATLAKAAPKDLVLKGDGKCTGCHDEADAPEALRIGKTKHGTNADKRTPTCTSCHGDSEKHLNHKGSDKPPKPDRTFGKKSQQSATEKSAACVSCHAGGQHMNWNTSLHATQDVACTSCHQVHTGHDKVRDKRTQPEVCFTCHKQQRVDIDKPSHHPITEGKMACSDCHNPHGSTGPKMMIKDSVTATCYTCHPEKRGPFVHNHAPVKEDCSICHNPHGTVANSMLKTRPPFLCQQCHDPSNHLGTIPGVAGTANSSNLAGVLQGNNSLNAVGVGQGRSCLNCHTEIHGSNSPANASKAMRFWR
jgi:DmsE family decaheme c-type cytochrome